MADPIEPAAPASAIPPEGGIGTRQEPPAAPPAPGADAAKNTPWPRLARMDYASEASSSSPATKPSGNRYQLAMLVAAQVCGFGLLLGGYFLGQAWAPTARPDAASNGTAGAAGAARRSQRAGEERSLDAANRALKAERGRDFYAARAIYEEMNKRQASLAGAEYRLALLSLNEENFAQTEAHLDRSIQAGDALADSHFLRATLAGMKNNFADASTQLAAAVRAKPFDAKLYFCWGESLRRQGLAADAVERLAQALDRPDSAAARELCLFKLRLAKVEAGNDDVFGAELDTHLAGASPGGDWQMLAAAREIGRKDYAAAAGRLGKAKAALPLEVFSVYAQDYLFQTQRSRPELSAALSIAPPVVAPTGDLPIQDPAAWTAAEADPAVWPPFPTAE